MSEAVGKKIKDVVLFFDLSKRNDITSQQKDITRGLYWICLEVFLLTENSRCRSERYWIFTPRNLIQIFCDLKSYSLPAKKLSISFDTCSSTDSTPKRIAPLIVHFMLGLVAKFAASILFAWE